MRILLVEDNLSLAEGLVTLLRQSGYAVDVVHDGASAEALAMAESFDLVILDLNLPQMDGLEVLRKMRARKNPAAVMILTARGTPEERVRGLDLGADDYLIKPFDLAELTARIGSVARRYAGNPNPLIQHGDLEIDLAARSVHRAGRLVPLTAREWALFEALLGHPGQLFSKAQLEDKLYAFGAEVESNTIEVHVSRLRKKLGTSVIETERGLGYRLGRG